MYNNYVATEGDRDLSPTEIFGENNQIIKEISQYSSIVESLSNTVEMLYSKLSEIVFLENTGDASCTPIKNKSDYCELANKIDCINSTLLVNVGRLNELLNSIKL